MSRNTHFLGYNLLCPTLQDLSPQCFQKALWSRTMLHYMLYHSNDDFAVNVKRATQGLPYRHLCLALHITLNTFWHFASQAQLIQTSAFSLLLVLRIPGWSIPFNHTYIHTVYKFLQRWFPGQQLPKWCTASLTLQNLKRNCNMCETTNSYSDRK